MNLKIEIFTKENFTYLFISLFFIPISLLVKYFELGLILNIVIIMVLCMTFYFGILFIKKDKNLYLILNKLLGKFGRRI
jgi:ABC-type multidrug transport system permease subunit